MSYNISLLKIEPFTITLTVYLGSLCSIWSYCISVEFSQIDANHNVPTDAMKADHSCDNNVPQKEKKESKISENNSEQAFYENLAIPISQLPVYIQKMKERGDGFQKEFQVSHCYVCL